LRVVVDSLRRRGVTEQVIAEVIAEAKTKTS
jgi:hypothetical protein